MGFTPFNPSYKNYCQVYSKGTASIPIDVGLQSLLLYRLWGQIDLATEHLTQSPFECDQPKEVQPGISINCNGQIDVALRAGLAARDRAEQ